MMNNSADQKQHGSPVIYGKSFLTEQDIYLFKAGEHARLYERMGAHPMVVDGQAGTHFSVWAPNAERIFLIGDFNGWNRQSHLLSCRWDSSGIWEGFIPGINPGERYKYFIISKHSNYQVEKKDPFGFFSEVPPQTASVVWNLDYQWQDHSWMTKRSQKNKLNSPWSIYEVHLGSWRRVCEEQNRFLSYREFANYLVDYVKKMGYTHVELMPIMDHPFYGSWGYQTVGYFSPTARYGSPQDLMCFIDCCHQNDIGVILDWVPSHFPADEAGLVYFDGTHLFEHKDPRQGFHPDWTSYIFNYGRREVAAFLMSSALFWLDKYHVDGLRVDAVASMLYLDYSRKNGDWIPNENGGRENFEAMHFLQKLNETIYSSYPDVQTIAEESTAWPMVSRPVYSGGLGFGMKWNMGWMHDTLVYFLKDSIYRKYHQNDLTFSMLYAFTENFVLSLSHDEVVHGKSSLLSKMPGDDWQKFANLRLLFGYMYGHPGKKLNFMGNEFGQWQEWHHEQSLDWHLLQYAPHHGLQKWMQDLNRFYRSEKALFEDDFTPQGFEWIDGSDWQQSIMSFLRKGHNSQDRVLVVCNFTPTVHHQYHIGVPYEGYWKEVLNSDAALYGGSNQGNGGGQNTVRVKAHGREFSLSLTLPPLGVIFLKYFL